MIAGNVTCDWLPFNYSDQPALSQRVILVARDRHAWRSHVLWRTWRMETHTLLPLFIIYLSHNCTATTMVAIEKNSFPVTDNLEAVSLGINVPGRRA